VANEKTGGRQNNPLSCHQLQMSEMASKRPKCPPPGHIYEVTLLYDCMAMENLNAASI
jgi:hypothetical protein